jgi:Raf kinase inhibitor-like YbhB/YbcL family protein
MSSPLFGAAVTVAIALAATRPGAPAQRMTLESVDFASGQSIPPQFSCDGPGMSPELSWSSAPPGTQTFMLVVHDTDVNGGIVHWMVYDIPASVTELPSAAVSHGPFATGAQQGTNGSGSAGWMPPCPPKGSTHRYLFELYALDTRLPVMGTPTQSALMAAIHGHVLAKAEMLGTYTRTR